MHAVAQKQLHRLDRLTIGCSTIAEDGSAGPGRFSAPSAPPFGTGTARSSPSGTFAHNIVGHAPKFTGFAPNVPRRSLPNRNWTLREAVTGSKEERQSFTAQSRPSSAPQPRRPANAHSASISPAHKISLRREIATIRDAKLQARSAAGACSTANREVGATQWLYTLGGQPLDQLLVECETD